MKIRNWMRVAAVLQTLFAFGHTVGGTPRVAKRGAQEAALFDATQNFRFDVTGTIATTGSSIRDSVLLSGYIY